MVGNGQNIHISHVGNCIVPEGNCPLPLKSVLVAPSIRKNLLSVSKLTFDYPCYFEFNKNDIFIKDSRNHEVLTSVLEEVVCTY
ncbi:hypothetical protein Pint_20580 [Pistacia integerrima]|uniref:Uncharacterized protein n=1 Tax=Pistacia integerrima TaxID=434235 RepID=A0ACC0XBF0_9ROSI|nr:hypothetical protein Pint_20580 [Pistacia integerrima]